MEELMSKRIETAATILARLRAKTAATDVAMSRHHWAVMTLARQSAIKEIKRQFQAQGLRITEVPAKVILSLADAYLDVYRAELVAEAEKTIATWPGFARWRCPETERASEPYRSFVERGEARANEIEGNQANE
jgi:hypothetical protein